MKIEFHNLMKTKTFNAGVAWLIPYQAVALGFIVFSITISWGYGKTKEQ